MKIYGTSQYSYAYNVREKNYAPFTVKLSSTAAYKAVSIIHCGFNSEYTLSLCVRVSRLNRVGPRFACLYSAKGLLSVTFTVLFHGLPIIILLGNTFILNISSLLPLSIPLFLDFLPHSWSVSYSSPLTLLFLYLFSPSFLFLSLNLTSSCTV